MSFDHRPNDGVGNTDTKNALEGIKVVEFAIADAGPLIGKYLGDFGADVVKVESRSRLDFNRVSAPFKDNQPGVNRSGSFVVANSSKYSLALDVKHPRARGLFERLVSWADVVIGGFAPDAMKRLGLVYDELKKIKPDIILLATSGQGATGPNSNHPAWGLGLRGVAGMDSLVGWPDRPPSGTAVAYTDRIAPWFGALAVMAAIDFHRRTGEGQHIDLSQVESSLHFMSPVLLDYFVNSRVQTRDGNRSRRSAPHNAYRCAGQDRWCVIAVHSDEEWENFCRVIGSPEWTRDHRFGTLLGRMENSDELDGFVESWTVNYTAEEIMDMMQRAGIPAGVVQTGEDIMDKDEHLHQRGYFQTLDCQEMGPIPHPRPPVILSKTPANLHPSPSFGEHTEYVCTKLLGLSDDAFVQLLEAGVFE